jgi:biopolymer transport protein ExbD
MIEFKEHEKSTSRELGLDLTPLIDMVFLLLIFFLLTSALTSRSVSVSLPRSDQGRSIQSQELIVTVAFDGTLLLNERPVTAEELSAAVEDLFNTGYTGELFVQADQGVRFQRVVDVMDIARRAGADTISFLVEKRE